MYTNGHHGEGPRSLKQDGRAVGPDRDAEAVERESSLMRFMETWLNLDVADSIVTLDGFSDIPPLVAAATCERIHRPSIQQHPAIAAAGEDRD